MKTIPPYVNYWLLFIFFYSCTFLQAINLNNYKDLPENTFLAEAVIDTEEYRIGFPMKIAIIKKIFSQLNCTPKMTP